MMMKSKPVLSTQILDNQPVVKSLLRPNGPRYNHEWHLARLYRFLDSETWTRHKEIQKLEIRVKELESKLRQRISKLERRVKKHEFTRGKNETLQANQKEETGTYSEYSSKRIADIG